MSAAVEHRFGPYGGQYVPETLMPALAELEAAWVAAREDPGFLEELGTLLRDFAGRPTPLYHAKRLFGQVGHPVYLKREDLLHTGAHKINNALGQCLLAKRMGKTRIIAETGAGQHGVATATACALLGRRVHRLHGHRGHAPPEAQRRADGADGRHASSPSTPGARTLKEAVSAAIRDWVANVGDTHYVIGSAVGPAPFPALVRDLQRVIGDESRAQVAGAARPAALARHRLRRRRLERDRHLRPVRRRRGGRADRRGGRRRRDRDRPPRRSADARRPRRRPARRVLGDHAGRGRPDPRGALDLGRARLPRHRPRARAPARQRAGALRGRHRRRRAGRLPAGREARGDRAGAGVLARRRVGARPGGGARWPATPSTSTSSASPGAATRTWPRRWPRSSAARDHRDHRHGTRAHRRRLRGRGRAGRR